MSRHGTTRGSSSDETAAAEEPESANGLLGYWTLLKPGFAALPPQRRQYGFGAGREHAIAATAALAAPTAVTTSSAGSAAPMSSCSSSASSTADYVEAVAQGRRVSNTHSNNNNNDDNNNNNNNNNINSDIIINTSNSHNNNWYFNNHISSVCDACDSHSISRQTSAQVAVAHGSSASVSHVIAARTHHNSGRDVHVSDISDDSDIDNDYYNNNNNDSTSTSSSTLMSGPANFCSSLYGGATFSGNQNSADRTYSVEVTLRHVDFDNSFVCGDLTIHNLTTQYPTMTTFFEGEIIGDKYSFLTNKWDADERVDDEHWKSFTSFRCDGLEKSFTNKDFVYDFRNSDFIYMRWKEQFLVHDHTIRNIKGASFAGFYYICLCRSTGAIEGFYFHSASELFQALKLKLVEERSFQAFDFR